MPPGKQRYSGSRLNEKSSLAQTAGAQIATGKSRLRFFGGLSLEEMGQVLEVSPKTVERDWQAARAWLFKMLGGAADGRDHA